MGSRMEKYHNNPKTLEKRTQRNEELYKNINRSKIEDYNIHSNVSVLDVPGNEIDIEKIKELLDQKYQNPIKRKSIEIEEDIEELKPEFETKDYDLSKILEEAKKEKVVDYAEERLKKLRDTQYDILNNLNLERPEEIVEEEPTELEKELLTMIETITSKEKETDINTLEGLSTSLELELLSDLKGDDDTVVVPPLTEEQKIEFDVTKKQAKSKGLENSFYTGNLKVHESDFEDFEDLKKEINSNSTIIKILVVLFTLVVVFGLVILFDKIFSWGIF
jgi:hypothetical protein